MTTYQLRPTHAVQAAHMRAVLDLASADQGVWHGVEHLHAVVRMKFGGLPDQGPWILTKVELRTLFIAIEWYSPKRRFGTWEKETPEEIKDLFREVERDVISAYESACSG